MGAAGADVGGSGERTRWVSEQDTLRTGCNAAVVPRGPMDAVHSHMRYTQLPPHPYACAGQGRGRTQPSTRASVLRWRLWWAAAMRRART